MGKNTSSLLFLCAMPAEAFHFLRDKTNLANLEQSRNACS
jgi:hypothetical protein